MAVGTKHDELLNSASKEVKLIRGTALIESELKMLLDFERYTLFFGNGIGLDARRFLHLPNKLATFNLIKSEIEKVIIKYGRVRLVKTEMKFNNTTNELEINLEVVPKGARSSINVALSLGN